MDAEQQLAEALLPTRRAREAVVEQADTVQSAIDAVRAALDDRDAVAKQAQLREIEVLRTRVSEGDQALLKALESLHESVTREINVTVLPAEVTVPVTVEAQKAAAPVVNVSMPDTFQVVPAETETIAERGRDGLITRSVTRPT